MDIRITSSHRYNRLYFLSFKKQMLLLVNFLFHSLNWRKVIHSLVNKEALGVKSDGRLGDKKPPWRDTSVLGDALVVKERAGLRVSETPTVLSCGWEVTLSSNNLGSVEDGGILWLTFVVVFWDAGKDEKSVVLEWLFLERLAVLCWFYHT